MHCTETKPDLLRSVVLRGAEVRLSDKSGLFKRGIDKENHFQNVTVLSVEAVLYQSFSMSWTHTVAIG